MSLEQLNRLASCARHLGWAVPASLDIAADLCEAGLTYRGARRQLRRMEGLPC